jgi:hypothetical protein
MSQRTSCTVARCEIVIFVCAIARSPSISTVPPPRKWRMLTPRSKPSRETRAKSAPDPWNQVAIMKPSSCQTVANRSQSPASRQSTHCSTMRRISSSSGVGPVTPRPYGK